MGSLQTCPPCNQGTSGRYAPTDPRIEAWLPLANASGQRFGLNPVTLLAIVSLESGGDPLAGSGTATPGLVQCGQGVLTAFNVGNKTGFNLGDLYNPAVALDVLAWYLGQLNRETNLFALSATSWNGAICGTKGSYYPAGLAGGGFPRPTGPSCYGLAAYQLASAYAPWWQDNSFYRADLPYVNHGNLNPPPLIQVNLG